jgi:hypothetical protein
MELTTQLALFLDNRPGTLARVCEVLAESKINIIAFSTNDTVDHTVVRMVVSDYRKAIDVFEERGALVVESEVLMVTGDNRPGSLAAIAQKLANAKINIDYAYCATGPTQKTGVLILRASNCKKAMKILNQLKQHLSNSLWSFCSIRDLIFFVRFLIY